MDFRHLWVHPIKDEHRLVDRGHRPSAIDLVPDEKVTSLTQIMGDPSSCSGIEAPHHALKQVRAGVRTHLSPPPTGSAGGGRPRRREPNRPGTRDRCTGRSSAAASGNTGPGIGVADDQVDLATTGPVDQRSHPAVAEMQRLREAVIALQRVGELADRLDCRVDDDVDIECLPGVPYAARASDPVRYQVRFSFSTAFTTSRISHEHMPRKWSGRRDSNPRHSAWEADTLPTELLPPGACSAAAHGRVAALRRQ